MNSSEHNFFFGNKLCFRCSFTRQFGFMNATLFGFVIVLYQIDQWVKKMIELFMISQYTYVKINSEYLELR